MINTKISLFQHFFEHSVEISKCTASECNQKTESLKGHHNMRSHQATVTTPHEFYKPFWAQNIYKDKQDKQMIINDS